MIRRDASRCRSSPRSRAIVVRGARPKPPVPQFHTSDRCVACHNGLLTASGEDVSIGFDWRASMMANSSRDPYWQASVRRETMDHAESAAAIEDECAICHMPIPRYEAKLRRRTRPRVRAPAVRRRREGRARRPPTACRAPCAIRSAPRGSAPARASTAALSCSRRRRPTRGRSTAPSKSSPDIAASC